MDDFDAHVSGLEGEDAEKAAILMQSKHRQQEASKRVKELKKQKRIEELDKYIEEIGSDGEKAAIKVSIAI